MTLGNKFGGKRVKSAIEVPKAPAPKPMKIKPPPPPPPPPPTPKEMLVQLTEKLNAENAAKGLVAPVVDAPKKADPREIEASLRSVLTDYASDPVGFVRDVLGVQPDKWQEDVMMAVAGGARRISVRAGHGVGKTAFCSWLLIWHMVTRYPQKSVCLAGDTLVLTQRGLIPMVSILTTDKVWDGVEWVTHSGLVAKGVKETIDLMGIRMTPDHRVLSGSTWNTAQDLVDHENILSRALATGMESLPSLDMLSEKTATHTRQTRQSLCGVHVARPSMRQSRIGSTMASCEGASIAPERGSDKKTLKILASSNSSQMLRQQNLTSLDWRALSDAVTRILMPVTQTMVAVASSAGGMSATARVPREIARLRLLSGSAKCWNICRDWMGGATLVSKLTASTSTEIMPQVISVSQRQQKIPAREGGLGMSTPQQWTQALKTRFFGNGSKNLKMRLPVYDLKNCGPRSRFTVWSDAGALIVHNCTAPTASQLYDALFTEVKFWINKLPAPIRALFEMTSEKVTLKSAPEASFVSARTSSADRPEALAGIHAEHVLLIVDEASAVPEAVFESAAGSMSGDMACTILIGNPTRNSGMFFQTHHKLSSDWKTFHVSCIDSPRVAKDFVEQIKTTYGPDSNAFKIRVLGEFALHDDDTLIPAELVDSAMGRDVTLNDKDPLVYGIDVARFGDDRSVLCKRRGNVVLEFKVWQGLDLMQLTGAITNEMKLEVPEEVCIDSIGLGSGVADRLREVVGELRLDINVRDVNVSESSAMNPQAAKLRDELWLAVKEWLNARSCKLPKMDDLRQELVAPTYTFTSNGKIKVEGKQEMKRRGMRSPDLSDSLGLTFASIASRVGGRGARWKKGQSLKRNIKGIV